MSVLNEGSPPSERTGHSSTVIHSTDIVTYGGATEDKILDEIFSVQLFTM